MVDQGKRCTACGACEQVCPQKCIRLTEDKEGFVYPEIDKEKCVNCGLCNKACHLNCEYAVDKQEQSAYAVAHKKTSVVKESTSGGAFTAIANYVLSKDGAVYGCAYNEEIKPIHIRVDNEQSLLKLKGSKYVQSEIGETYAKAKEDLENGKTVLYSGTPCQIAGLRAFLRKDYDNLITADLICHGVPSYAYFAKFLKWYEIKNGVEVTNFDFRSKGNRGWSLAGLVTAKSLQTGKQFSKKLFYHNSYYYHYFLNGDIYRDCCYECKYTNLDRPSDFTMGDLWGAEGLNLPFDTVGGCSVLLINTAKAKSIFSLLDIVSHEVDLDFVVENNKQLQEPTKKPAFRDQLIEEYCSCNAQEIQSKYKKRYRVARLKAKVKYMMPSGLKKLLLKIRYRNKK